MRRSLLIPMRSQTPLLLVALALSPEFSAAAPLRSSVVVPSPPGREAPADPERVSREAATVGGTADWWTRVRGDLERQEYTGSATEDGWQAPNRAQNLRTKFRNVGVEVAPRVEGSAGWRLCWETVAWGREGHMSAVTPSTPVSRGARIEYRRKGLVEWYENKKEGLEQGFTLTFRPHGEGPLQIRGRVASELRARASEGGEGVDFLDERAACVLRYGKLVVLDAQGTKVDARLKVDGGSLSIEVDDRSAAYPLTVDPLMTTPAWSAEGDQASAQFGFSVATAGDVNGDGFSDVIVGAPTYDNGQDNEGRVFLYLGSASGLVTPPAWTAESDIASAFLGNSVATAGDVNGDGYSDVIIGAPYYANGQSGEGRAVLYLGSASGLATTPVWAVESDKASAFLGYSVATAGDVNGDGYSDVIVGAPSYENGQSEEGRAFVYLGSPSGLATTPAWTAEGNRLNANFGYSVATAGDVNGDGYSDVIVGAYLFTNDQAVEGRAFVFLGSASGLATVAAWTAEGDQGQAQFGNSVSTAGDVNGDGYSDVIVGAFSYDNGQSDEGRAFLYLGSASGLATTAVWTAESNQASAQFGYSVATAGDVNGDGYADVIVGAPQYSNGQATEGRTFVYLGSPLGLATTAIWTAEGDQASAYFGQSAATAGDVNGDGYSDVIVGAYLFDNGETNEGRAYVYLGSASGLATALAWVAESDQAGAKLGVSVASAGDVNGDGYSDVIVGAWNYDDGEVDEGRAYVYLGSASGLAATAAWTAESNQVSAWFGTSVSTAGDVNGDGYSDVIVSAVLYDSLQVNQGRAYVYLGSASGLAATAAWTAEGEIPANQPSALFGASVATAGDVNGDGYSDVIVGSSAFDNGQAYEGKAYVYLGSASGLAATAAWTAESDQLGARLGASVATAGDVNGDGYSDVIVGAYLYANGQVNEGRAFVYLGSASGLAPTAAWTAESDQASAQFGTSVSTAGDVNGDGYSDVVVGALNYDNGETNEGRAYVYLGSASGLASTAAWTAESNQASASFGNWVATAGDVNGDGYSDVIVGANFYDGGQTDEGRAYVYLGSASGLASTVAWTAEINQAGEQFGVSVATAGDVNGDGYSDVIVGAYLYDNGQADEGGAFVYYGNGGDGLDRIPRQSRPNVSTPISLLGRLASDAFNLRALGRSPAGRGKVRMEWEAKPLGTAFSAAGHTLGSAVNTGAPVGGTGSATPLSGLVAGLQLDTPYRWRLRILTDSPFFPGSPWLSLPYNNSTETDLRTGSLPAAVPEPTIGSEALRMEMIRPNPSRTEAVIHYALPGAGRAVLWLHDLQGRRIALLVDGVQTAGPHSVTWDGRDQNGRRARSGIYWARLRFGDAAVARKLVHE